MQGMTQIVLNGHRTWAKLPKKKGATVVLLHGGLSKSSTMLRVLGPRLSKHFEIAAFDRRGHGRSADTDDPFSFDAMADETIAFLEYLGRPSHLIGHSDGANVALLVALRRPDLVRRVVLVGANYHHYGLMPMPAMRAEGADFDELVEYFASNSPDGAEHAAVAVEKSRVLWASEPTLSVEDLVAITVPVLVMAGDDDVAQLSHTVSMYEAIPEAQLAILPGTSHLVLKERTRDCTRIMVRFLTGPVPPVTMAPLRRHPDAP